MRNFCCFLAAFAFGLSAASVLAEDSLKTSPIEEGIFLNEIEHDTAYFPFRDEKVTSTLGYGFYRDKARIDLQEENGVLTMNYGLPRCFEWGNWLGVRRKFKNITDFSTASGIEFDLKVDSASYTAKFRITLCDISKVKRFSPYSRDYMWWCDFKDKLLRETRDWITIRIPFDDFRHPWGGGTRPSPSKTINTSRITSYEFNIITDQTARGQIKIRNLKTY